MLLLPRQSRRRRQGSRCGRGPWPRQGSAHRKKSNASRLRRAARRAGEGRGRWRRLLNRLRLPRPPPLPRQGSAHRKRSSSSKWRLPRGRVAKASGEAPVVIPAPAPIPETAPAPVTAAAPPEPSPAEASQTVSAVTGVGAKRTPEEIERLKAEAVARRAAKAGGETQAARPCLFPKHLPRRLQQPFRWSRHQSRPPAPRRSPASVPSGRRRRSNV